jgi:hypothetical protein
VIAMRLPWGAVDCCGILIFGIILMNVMPRVCSVSISISNGIEVRSLWDCHGAVVGLLGE